MFIQSQNFRLCRIGFLGNFAGKVWALSKIIQPELRVLLINVYAPNDVSERMELFKELEGVVQSWGILVLIGGDFNCIRVPEEKVGAEVNLRALEDFNEFIESLELVDLPLQGVNLPGLI
ncbi:hypothetical protein V6N13_080496 [Hibiscus sabdariffa]